MKVFDLTCFNSDVTLHLSHGSCGPTTAAHILKEGISIHENKSDDKSSFNVLFDT